MGNDIIATAGLDISQFKTSASGMVTAADGAGKAIEKVGRNGRRDLGGVAMQAQDIAVQLQSGTDAARVLGQQGSQIASLFGPTGAIIGGVIAIGAAIYTWVTSAEQTNAELEKLSKWSIAEAKRLREINAAKKEETARIKEQAEILRTQREIGQKQADDLKHRLDLENQIQDIQEKGRKEGVTEENINAQIRAAKELAALQKRAADVDRERARIQKVIDETTAKAREEQQAAEIREQTKALKRQLEGETEIQRARQLLLQAARLEQNLIFKSGVERANQEKEVIRLRLEAKNIQDSIAKKQAEDARKLNAEIVGGIAGAVEDTARKLADVTKDAAKDAISMAKEAQRIADDAQQKAKDAVEEKIAERLKTPQQRREDRKAQKDREKAIRSIDARERAGEAARARGAYGQKNVFAHSPSKATAMAEKALQQRALQNITAATLVVNSVMHK